jgi:hypothetical protein
VPLIGLAVANVHVTDEVVLGRLLKLFAAGDLTVAKALLEWLGRLVQKQPPERELVMSWAAGDRGRKGNTAPNHWLQR